MFSGSTNDIRHVGIAKKSLRNELSNLGHSFSILVKNREYESLQSVTGQGYKKANFLSHFAEKTRHYIRYENHALLGVHVVCGSVYHYNVSDSYFTCDSE